MDALDNIAALCATQVLQLRLGTAQDFIPQFCQVARRSLAYQIDGGDAQLFRQALAIPVAHAQEGGDCVFHDGMDPVVVVEWANGFVSAVQFTRGPACRLPLRTLVTQLAPILASGHRPPAIGKETEARIARVLRRRLTIVDWEFQDPEAFWNGPARHLKQCLLARVLCGLPAIRPAARQEVWRRLRPHLDAAHAAACEQFTGQLDPQVIALLMARRLSFSASRYNHYFQLSRQSLAYLVQAVNVMPVLNALLNETSFEAKRLHNLVGEGQPLWPALSGAYRVPEEVLRWLRGKDFDLIGEAWRTRFGLLLTRLAPIAPEKRPVTAEDWQVFTHFALGDLVRQESFYQGWLKAAARQGWTAVWRKMEHLGATLADWRVIPELIEEVSTAVLAHCAPEIPEHERHADPRWEGIHDRVEAIFLRAGIAKQLRASMEWHAQLLTREEASGGMLPVHAEWPAPISLPMVFGEHRAQFLSNRMQLDDEGQRLEHCVGSYARKCSYEFCSIVSIRNRAGHSLSTAELTLARVGDHYRFSVRQHASARNQRPSDDCVETLRQLLAHLHGEPLQPALEELHDWQWKQVRAAGRTGPYAEPVLSARRFGRLERALGGLGGFERFMGSAG